MHEEKVCNYFGHPEKSDPVRNECRLDDIDYEKRIVVNIKQAVPTEFFFTQKTSEPFMNTEKGKNIFYKIRRSDVGLGLSKGCSESASKSIIIDKP